jgi:hypothetical protein
MCRLNYGQEGIAAPKMFVTLRMESQENARMFSLSPRREGGQVRDQLKGIEGEFYDLKEQFVEVGRAFNFCSLYFKVGESCKQTGRVEQRIFKLVTESGAEVG